MQGNLLSCIMHFFARVHEPIYATSWRSLYGVLARDIFGTRKVHFEGYSDDENADVKLADIFECEDDHKDEPDDWSTNLEIDRSEGNIDEDNGNIYTESDSKHKTVAKPEFETSEKDDNDPEF